MSRDEKSISDWIEHACKSRPLNVLIIILSVFIVYSNSFTAPFILDDITNIVNNSALRSIDYFINLSLVESSDVQEVLKPLFHTRYIGYLSFALNYTFGGLDVRGYHLVNMAIHACNSLLLYGMLSLLFTNRNFAADDGKSSGGQNYIVFFSAMLFAVHPLQTQAVSYIVQRFASLATLFYLLTIVTYLKFRMSACPYAAETKSAVKAGFYYTASLVSAIFAMKTKEFSVSLPVTMLLVEVMFLEGGVWKRIVRLTPFVLTTLLIPLSLYNAGGGFFQGKGLGEAAAVISRAKDVISWSDYLFTQFRVIVTYIRLLVFPTGQNVDYDYTVYRSLFSLPVLASLAFLLSLILCGVWLCLKSGAVRQEYRFTLKLVPFGIFWFFVTLIPESGIIPINDVIFEHRVYLPSIGYVIALTASLDLIARTWEGKRPGVMLFVRYATIILIVVFAAATCARNMVWADDVSLWEDVTKKSPNKARPYNNLGVAYHARGQLDKAVDNYLTAIKLQPEFVEAQFNLAATYQSQGFKEKAAKEYLKVLKLNPNFAEARYNLAYIYVHAGNCSDAAKEFQEYLRSASIKNMESRVQLENAIKECR